MKICNCLFLCCTCEAWCSACCGWLCLLSVCGTALKHLDTRSGLKTGIGPIMLNFLYRPLLCITGCANCIILSFGSFILKETKG